ncbi:MAG: acyloxyacyl hydrolase [Acidobacteriaceae bacterium]|jgi:hypothetical protein|nr:acyloxyacyl hydrolase [Acidobacteriaceae bacterium]
MLRSALGLVFLLFVCTSAALAQPTDNLTAAADTSSELTGILSRTYFTFQGGAIDYRFSDRQLGAGFSSDEVLISHGAVRLVLFGFKFNKYFAGQISYGRPVQYVRYTNVNGTGQTQGVSVAIGEVTLKAQVPFAGKTSLYAEVGANETTRRGFTIDNDTIIDNAHVASFVVGGGVEYHLNERWDLLAGVNYASGHPQHLQPETVFASTGFRYNLQGIAQNGTTNDGYFFAADTLQVGYTSNALGYGVNNFVSGKVPIFWGGVVPASSGGNVRYQHMAFHSEKVFSFDLGVSAGLWTGNETGERFATISGYPLLRFTLLRQRAADVYLSYSAAGPTFISKSLIDGHATGTNFTFQDMLGLGAYLTNTRHLVAELNIAHYSNGNLFFQNPGIKIPLTFSLGYVF